MKKDVIVGSIAIAAVLLLGGSLTWSYYKSKATNIPPPPPAEPQKVIPTPATGNPEDVYA
jgi:hypothetical protein